MTPHRGHKRINTKLKGPPWLFKYLHDMTEQGFTKQEAWERAMMYAIKRMKTRQSEKRKRPVIGL